MRWLVPFVSPFVEIAYAHDAAGNAVFKRVIDHTEPAGSEWRVRYYRAEWQPCEPPEEEES